MKTAGRPISFGRRLASAVAQVGRCVAAEDARAQTTTLRLTPERAAELALDHDLDLKRARFGPQIADLEVRAAMTAWSPELSTRVLGSGSEAPLTNAIDRAETLTNRQVSSEVPFSQRLAWGASYRVGWDAARAERAIRLQVRDLADTDLAAARAATKRKDARVTPLRWT